MKKLLNQKNILSLLIAMSMMFADIIPAFAFEGKNMVIDVDGQIFEVSTEPYETENGLMVNAEDVSKALSIDYEFDLSSKAFIVNDNSYDRIILMHNATQYYKGGQKLSCNTCFYIENDMPMVELDFFCKLFDKIYIKSEEENKIYIMDKELGEKSVEENQVLEDKSNVNLLSNSTIKGVINYDGIIIPDGGLDVKLVLQQSNAQYEVYHGSYRPRAGENFTLGTVNLKKDESSVEYSFDVGQYSTSPKYPTYSLFVFCDEIGLSAYVNETGELTILNSDTVALYEYYWNAKRFEFGTDSKQYIDMPKGNISGRIKFDSNSYIDDHVTCTLKIIGSNTSTIYYNDYYYVTDENEILSYNFFPANINEDFIIYVYVSGDEAQTNICVGKTFYFDDNHMYTEDINNAELIKVSGYIEEDLFIIPSYAPPKRCLKGTINLPEDGYTNGVLDVSVDIFGDNNFFECASVNFDQNTRSQEFSVDIEDVTDKVFTVRVYVSTDMDNDTNIYSYNSDVKCLYYGENGLTDNYSDIKKIDVDEFINGIDMTLVSGKMISGKINVPDNYKEVSPFTSGSITYQSSGTDGNYYGSSSAIIDDEFNYKCLTPYNMGKKECSLSFTPNVTYNNLIDKSYNYINSDGSNRVLIDTLSNDYECDNINFNTETGYTVSGIIELPEDSDVRNYRINNSICLSNNNIYLSKYISNDYYDMGVNSSNREIPFIFGLDDSKTYDDIQVMDDVYSYYISEKYKNASATTGGIKMDSSMFSNIYLDSYYYKNTDSSTFSRDDASKITIDGDISDLRIKLSTGPVITQTLYKDENCDHSISSQTYLMDKDGKIVYDGKRSSLYIDDEFCSAMGQFVLHPDFLNKEYYVAYRVSSYDESNNIYRGFLYLDSNGDTHLLKRESKPITIKNVNNINFDMKTKDQINLPKPVFESDHPYQIKEYTYNHPKNADSLEITFSDSLKLADYSDSIEILDQKGNLIDKIEYSDVEKCLGRTFVIPGSSFTIKFKRNSTYNSNAFGFEIIDIHANGERCFKHHYGDWIVDSQADILHDGERHRACSECDYVEKESIKYQPAADDVNFGKAEFNIVNANSPDEKIENAQIFITTSEFGEETFVTDENGYVSHYLPVGTFKASVYKEGLNIRNFNITVTHDGPNIYDVGLSSRPLVEAKVSSKVMNYDEIIKAGIDVNAPGNNHVVKYELKLSFGTETADITTYFNNDHVNISEPAKVCLKNGTTVNVYPVSENCYLMVYGEVQWLKEMFDVEMLVLNNSLTDTVEDCKAQLTLPDGLSLAELCEGEQSVLQTLALGKGESKSLHWYVKGDKAGEYNIGATLFGKMMPLGDEFNYNYTLEDPVKVYAGNAMHMDVYVPDMTFFGDSYPITIEITNVSDRTLYNVSHSINYFKEGNVTRYSNGEWTQEEYCSSDKLASLSSAEFKPGDKIKISVVADIDFRDSLFGSKLGASDDTLNELKKAYDAYMSGAELIDGSYSFMTEFSNKLEDIISQNNYQNDELDSANKLLESISEFTSLINSVNNYKAMSLIEQLKTTGIYNILIKIDNTNDVFGSGKFTVKKILSCSKTIMGICNAANITDSDKKVNEEEIFKLLENAVGSIPVKYYLVDAAVSTLEGSTTSIPYTIHTITPEERFFGIDKVDDYLDSLAQNSLGEYAEPQTVRFHANENRQNASTQRVTLTKGKTTRFAATDNMGDIVFTASVNSNDCKLSTTKESEEISQNVLKFIGSGFVEVTPSEIGEYILTIDMLDPTTDNHVQTSYTLEVLDEHECSGEWVTLVSPSEDVKGYKVKRCSTCGTIMGIEECTDACENHIFGEYETDCEADDNNYGMKHRTCSVCGHVQYLIIDPEQNVHELILTPESKLDFDTDNGFVKNVAELLKPEQIKAHFQNENIDIVNYDGNKVGADTLVGTGCKVELKNDENGTTETSLTIVVKGDTNGDGRKSINDLVKIFNHIKGQTPLESSFREAALYNDDDRITVGDLVTLFNAIQKKGE